MAKLLDHDHLPPARQREKLKVGGCEPPGVDGGTRKFTPPLRDASPVKENKSGGASYLSISCQQTTSLPSLRQLY
jgi:hypothetical protein